MNNNFTVEVFAIDEKDLGIELPDDLMDRMGWSVGDNLTWEEREDGSWLISIKKK